MYKFKLINMTELKYIMKNMNGKKDYNGLSTRMLLSAMDIVGPSFLNVLNNSLSSGIFPEHWKKSTVVPIAKVKNTVNPAEFRPVNMLMTESKVLEKIVHKQLQSFLESNNYLSDYQS